MKQDWQKVEELFHQASDRAPDERSAFLASACAGDAVLLHEVEGLLSADSSDRDLPTPFVSPTGPAPGVRLDRYEILQACGQGATGTVYHARDTETGSDVAIKIFPPFRTAEQRRRYLKEARATAPLHHPHIARVQRVGKAGDRDYLVMDYVDGRTLGAVIPTGGLPIERALDLARMILDGLAAAHRAGIVHRDLKPSNLMLDCSGQVKILDFGLAKMIEGGAESAGADSRPSDERLTASLGTATGQIIGTACYLSPEQAEGFPVDARSDVFSFGVVLYEMLTGEKPFDRGSLAGTLSSILRDTPPSVSKLSPGTPRDVVRLVERCLEKNRDKRFRTAAEAQDALLACQARLRSPRYRAVLFLRRPRILVPALVLLAALLCGAAFWGMRWMRVRNARQVIEPEIASLVEQHLYNAADELVRRIAPIVPTDAPVREFRRDYRLVTSVLTTPPGAEVAIKDYATPNAPWRVLGKAPLPKATIPLGYFRWRVTAPAYRTREFAETGILQPTIHFTLYPDAGNPPDMVLIPAGGNVNVPEFWLDRFEVTNRQYLEFVKAGGYRRREFWQEPFARDGATLTWDQAMESFHDQTGRPGPATWELETYPDGKADFPVTGVSWYEAAAYARFAGKSLPTWFHWRRAARSEALYADPVLASNFSGKGLAPVGSFQAMDRYGTYDLAGNAKEWIWNEAAPGMRLVLGGAWDEAYYASAEPDVAPPMDRRSNIGFRCAKYIVPPTEAFTERVKLGPERDFTREKPVDDATFTQFKKLYDYAPTPLRASVDATDETDRYWRTERVSFDATYGNQRVTAYLFIPRGAKPPYQTVVYYPSGIAFSEKSSSRLEMWYLSPLIRSGRAVLYPVLWGTYERRENLPVGVAQKLGLRTIREIQDLRRSLDYLDTRADIDQRKLAFFGFSSGALLSPIALAVEPRFQAAILAVGGLSVTGVPPETDPLNFASRAKTPVLMMNGRYDNRFPLEASGRPLINLFGAPRADKKLVILETGHAMVGFPATTRESLAWLDRYLGPVR